MSGPFLQLIYVVPLAHWPVPFFRLLQFLVLLKALSNALYQVNWPIALHSIGLVRTDSGHAPAVSRRFTSFHAQGCLMSVVSMLFPCRFFVFGVSDVFEISQGCVKHHDSMSWCTNTKTKGVERERHDFITKINGFDTVYHMCVYIYIYIRMYMRYSTHTCIDVVHTSVYQTKVERHSKSSSPHFKDRQNWFSQVTLPQSQSGRTREKQIALPKESAQVAQVVFDPGNNM